MKFHFLKKTVQQGGVDVIDLRKRPLNLNVYWSIFVFPLPLPFPRIFRSSSLSCHFLRFGLRDFSSSAIDLWASMDSMAGAHFLISFFHLVTRCASNPDRSRILPSARPLRRSFLFYFSALRWWWRLCCLYRTCYGQALNHRPSWLSFLVFFWSKLVMPVSATVSRQIINLVCLRNVCSWSLKMHKCIQLISPGFTCPSNH